MPEITSETPHEDYTVQGLTFSMPQPYAPGAHELTEGEASALNQVRCENLRNNFANKIRGKLDDYRKANNLAEDSEVGVDVLDKSELDSEFAEFASRYEFGVRTGNKGGRAPADPVGREANKMAWEAIKGHLKSKNYKLDDISTERKATWIAQYLAKYPNTREKAQERVNEMAEIAKQEIDL